MLSKGRQMVKRVHLTDESLDAFQEVGLHVAINMLRNVVNNG